MVSVTAALGAYENMLPFERVEFRTYDSTILRGSLYHASTGSSHAPTVIEDSPAIVQSPFNDQTETPTETDNKRNSAFLDGSDASTKRHSGAPPPRGESPFADVNEVK